MSRKTAYLTKAAVIAALYAALTYASAALNLAYGAVQFRISEALTILPIFTPAAIPGLVVGCIVSNITSTINPIDMVVGSLATLLAALLTRKLRHITVKKLPFFSLLAPVLMNAVFVGAEIAWFETNGDRAAFPAAFWVGFAGVFIGEAAVCFLLGSGLYFLIRKDKRLSALLQN